MNLYKIVIKDATGTGIYGEPHHVAAKSAKSAIDKAYKKHDKMFKDGGNMVVHSLELVDEGF